MDFFVFDYAKQMLFVQGQHSQFFGSTWEISSLAANMGEGYYSDSSSGLQLREPVISVLPKCL